MPFLNPQSYLFLTTKPMARRLHTLQSEWLYILPLVDIAVPTLSALITYTDGTELAANKDLTELLQYEVKLIDLSYATQEWDQETPAKTIRKIEVWINIEGEEGDRITYYPWTPSTDNLKQFFYFNSLGGMDSFICTGDGQEGYEYTGDIAVRQIDDLYRTEWGQELAINQRARAVFTAYSGYKPKTEIQAVRDMLMVNDIYLLEAFGDNSRFVPVRMNVSALSLPPDLSNLNSFDFQYRYRWEDRALDRVR